MIRKVFIDFDGTLIDSRIRLFRLFAELTGNRELSFDKYWKMKRQGVLQEEMFYRFSKRNQSYTEFKQQWIEKIEDKGKLELDVKQSGADKLLHYLKKTANVYLWTNRQKKDNVNWEVCALGWKELFDDVLVTEQKYTKAQMLICSMKGLNFSDVIVIGDTLEDYNAAEQLGLDSYLVYSGISDFNMLKETVGNKFCNDIEELLGKLRRLYQSEDSKDNECSRKVKKW